MATQHFLRGVPGVLATLLIIVAATLMAVGGTASLFYEGWGQPVWRMLGYIAPALVLLVLGLIALRWPAAGGVLLLLAATGAGARWVSAQMQRGMAPFDQLFLTVLMMMGPVVAAALLFLFEARHQRLLRQEGVAPSSRRVVRHWREVLLVALPSVGVAALSAQQLPALLARLDDGERGERTIAGNGITLVWAPQGPGWNWQAPDLGYPSWEAVARYGAPAHGRCAYLNEEGTALLAAPVGVWRLPSADEIVRSLTRGGENAECAWDGRSPHAACRRPPDKETPLWAPDQAPIYYWSAQGAGPTTAFAINYTGGISVLPRSVPRLGIGFRCVKAVTGSLSP